VKKVSLLFVVVLLILALVPISQAQEPVTLVIGTTDDIAKLDPADAYSFHDWELLRNVNDGLMGYQPGSDLLEPRLAVDFPEVSEDGLTYTFTLREDATYPDGTVLTGQDVVDSINRSLTLQGDPYGLISIISGVAAEGNVITFTLSAPFDLFPHVTALPPTFPASPGLYPTDAIQNDPGSVVGVGAYQVTEYTLGETTVLEKNPNYWGEEGEFDRIVYVYYEEAAQLDAAIEAGDIDIAHRANTAEQAEALTGNDAFTVLKYSDGIRYLIFNHNLVPDLAIRQAVATAVDRDEIIDRALNGAGTPLYSMVPAAFLGATEAFLDTYGFGDSEAAAAILTEAGYSADNPLTIDLWYPPNRYAGVGEIVMEVLEEQLEATGVVDVTLQSAEWSTYIVAATSGEYPVFFLGWFFDYPDTDNYLHPFASTEGSPGLGVNYSNPDMDALLTQERAQVTDPEARIQTFAELQQLYADDVVTLPLFSVDNYMIFNNAKVSEVPFGAPLILELRTITGA
jgi:peptide/nickel transport system substrate-binding protein